MIHQLTASAFSRHLELRYPSNRFAVAVSVAAGAIFVGFAWWDDRFTYFGAVAAAIAVFLAWAIGREFDPDHTSVAGIAAVSAIGVVFIGLPGALVVFAVLIAVRGIAGTTGRTLKWVDVLPLGAAGYASGGSVWSWSVAIIIFAWLKSDPDVGKRRWWGVGALSAGFGLGWYLGDLDPIVFSWTSGLLGIGVVALTMLAVASVSAHGPTDSGRGSISADRVRLARLAGGIIALAAVLLGGQDALLQLGPVACALGATALIVVAGWVGLVDADSARSRTESA